MARTTDMPTFEDHALQAGSAHSAAVSAIAYGAMTAQTAITTASTHQNVSKGARSMVARGRDLQSGARERKTTRAGKAGDKVALKAAQAAETPAAAAIRSLGATNLGMTATRAASIAAKFALPVMAAKALFDAGRGYQKDGIRGAILGAGDSVAFGRASAALTGWQQGGAAGAVDGLTFGMMAWAARQVAGASQAARAPSKGPSAPNNDAKNTTTEPNRLDASEARAFQRADMARGARQGAAARAEPSEKAPTSGLIGFQNPSTIQAALAAQGKTLKNEPVVRTA